MPSPNLGMVEVGKYAQVPAMFFKGFEKSWQGIVRTGLFREKPTWIHTVGGRDTHKAFCRRGLRSCRRERFKRGQGNTGSEPAKKIASIH